MQVFKAFLKIAKRKLPDALIYCIVFLGLAVGMSFGAESEDKERFVPSEVNLCIIDEDQTVASQALTDFLSSRNHRITLPSYDKESLQDQLYYEQIAYILSIPQGFEDRLLSGETRDLVQVSRKETKASGYFIDRQVNTYLGAISHYLTGDFSLSEAVEAVNHSLESLPEVQMVASAGTAGSSNGQLYYYYLYLPYILLMVMIIALAPVLTAFHRGDLTARITCSSLSSRQQSVQMYLGCAVCSILLWGTFVLLSVILYGPGNIFSPAGLLHILNSFLFLLFVIALTLILGNFQINDNARSMIANVVSLGMGFLCGLFVPQQYLGENVLRAARFLPMYWYIKAANYLKGSTGELFSLPLYLKYLGIEFLYVIAAFCIYLVLGKQRKKVPDSAL